MSSLYLSVSDTLTEILTTADILSSGAPNPQLLESWRLVYINYLSISYHTIIHLVFPGTFDLTSLKVDICLGQYATGGVWQMLTRKINHKVLVWKWICNPMQAIKTGEKKYDSAPRRDITHSSSASSEI